MRSEDKVIQAVPQRSRHGLYIHQVRYRSGTRVLAGAVIGGDVRELNRHRGLRHERLADVGLTIGKDDADVHLGVAWVLIDVVVVDVHRDIVVTADPVPLIREDGHTEREDKTEKKNQSFQLHMITSFKKHCLHTVYSSRTRGKTGAFLDTSHSRNCEKCLDRLRRIPWKRQKLA